MKIAESSKSKINRPSALDAWWEGTYTDVRPLDFVPRRENNT